MFKEKYRWRSGIEATFTEMDKKTGVQRLRVRGLSAVAYFARLKAIAVNLFRATRVKKALDALRAAPGTTLSAIASIFLTVKERFLSPWRRPSNIFKALAENMSYTIRIVA